MPTAVNSSNSNSKQLASMTSNLKAAEKMGKALGTDTTGVQNALQKVSGNQAQSTSSTKVSLSSEGVARLQAEKATPTVSTTPQANVQANTQAKDSSASATSSAARPEKRQFSSVDEALAYGANRAAEQASSRSTPKTANTNGEANSAASSTAAPVAASSTASPAAARSTSTTAAQPGVSSSNRPENRKFSSIDEALAYGASRAAEQAGNRAQVKTTNASETGSINATNTRNDVASTNRSETKRFSSVDEAISYGAQRAVEQYSKQQSAIRGTA